MISDTTQSRNTVTDGDLVGRDKIINNNHSRRTKLSALFERLQQEFDSNRQVGELSDNLKRYSDRRDRIGLEQKLIEGNRAHVLEDAIWLKQEYTKKLTRFQFFEPAQEIHAFLLGLVLERFRNIVSPMIRNDCTDVEISRAISMDIVAPVLSTIQEEGCDDIMGLSSTDIEGMIFFLTGQCHIKWVKL